MQFSHGFWKVMEIENANFYDLECLGKKWIFKMAMEMFRIFARKDSKDILKWIWLSVVVNMYGYAMFVHFTIYNTKHLPS